MSRSPVIVSLMSLVLLLASGCSNKKTDDTTKVPLDVKVAESMDSTRLDSALTDTFVEDSQLFDTSGR